MPKLALGATTKLVPGAVPYLDGAPPPGAAPDSLPGLVGWFQGDADTATYFTKSFGKVTEWRDQSGNGNHLRQTNSNFQAATAAGLNGKTALDMQALGGSEWYSAKSSLGNIAALMASPAGLTVVTVMREQVAVPPANQYCFGTKFDGATTVRQAQLLNKNLNPDQWMVWGRNGGGGQQSAVHPASYDTAWHFFVYRWAQVAGTVEFDIDGVKASTTGATQAFTTFNEYFFGTASLTSSGYGSQLMQEHFFYNARKSDADIANLRLWLQNKYASLP